MFWNINQYPDQRLYLASIEITLSFQLPPLTPQITFPLKSNALEVTNLLSAKRDPVLRPETVWSDATLERIINE
ncbi:hypothetical protein VN97_g553 [Penicillium thymicola]|uniref:Uncharacterized protein n=1 Tax=Penicillium thymicola TaxID=293382 RepID=A0AAI9TSJ8_PENTH|nr:hypothetical protein VN97_g553 [Penicillium thymicola]